MRRISFYLFLIIGFLLSFNLLSFALNSSDKLKQLTGNVLVNISGQDKYYEYQLDLSLKSLAKTKESKTVMHTQDGSAVINKSTNFVEAEKLLKKEPRKLKWLGMRFSKNELIAISDLFTESIIGKCETNSIHPIKDLDDGGVVHNTGNMVDQTSVFADHQLKYAVLNNAGLQKGSGAIINIREKEIIFPFCGNVVRDLALSPDGQFIAYSIGEVKKLNARTLVIYDIHDSRIILKNKIDDYISRLTWSPLSDHVALISKKTRFFSLNPLDIMGFISGHPTEYSNFSLRIFDLQGEVKLISNFVSNVKNASSDILWDKLP